MSQVYQCIMDPLQRLQAEVHCQSGNEQSFCILHFHFHLMQFPTKAPIEVVVVVVVVVHCSLFIASQVTSNHFAFDAISQQGTDWGHNWRLLALHCLPSGRLPPGLYKTFVHKIGAKSAPWKEKRGAPNRGLLLFPKIEFFINADFTGLNFL